MFNGSSISVIKQLLPTNLTSAPEQGLAPENINNFLLFFQHYAGDIRWIQSVWPDTWHGGSAYDLVASDAKNGTPISAVKSDFDNIHQTHVFCQLFRIHYGQLHVTLTQHATDVNTEGLLRERVIDNSTYVWNDGALNQQNIKVLNADTVGMQACFYGGPLANVNLNGTDAMSGIRLWVAIGETKFEQYAWRSGLSSWTREQSSWNDMNGHASPTCYSWDVGQTTYVMFVDVEDRLVIYWCVLTLRLRILGILSSLLTLSVLVGTMRPSARKVLRPIR